MELSQKSTRLEQSTQQQKLLQDQLSKAAADLKSSAGIQEQATQQLADSKIELDKAKIDLAAKTTQLETTLLSMQTQVGIHCSKKPTVAHDCTPGIASGRLHTDQYTHAQRPKRGATMQQPLGRTLLFDC